MHKQNFYRIRQRRSSGILTSSCLMVVFWLISTVSLAQAEKGVAISPTNAAPHDAAMLDVQSTDKGYLSPRVSATEQMAITPLPGADGLLVFVDSPAKKRGMWLFDQNASGGAGEWVRYGIDIEILIPVGIILPFNSTQCPAGWSPFVDGQGRFLTGTGNDGFGNNYVLAGKGGEATVKLDDSKLPEHQHKVTFVANKLKTDADRHGHEIFSRSKGTSVGAHRTSNYSRGKHRELTDDGLEYEPHKHDVSGTVTGTSDHGLELGAEHHENRPKYISLTYCTRTGY